MVRAPGARGGCQRRSCWPRRTGCRFPRRGNAYLLHSFPHSTPPLLRRRKCGRETNSSSRSVCFFFFFKESTTFTAHREGAWREAVGLPSRFTPGQSSPAPRDRPARASAGMRALRPARWPRGPVPQKPRRRQGGRARASEEKASPSRLRASAAACAESARAPRGSIEKLSISFTNRRRGGPGRTGTLSERGRQRGAGRRGG